MKFGEAALTYDQHAVFQKKAALRLVDLGASLIPQDLHQIHEIGCGTGFLTGAFLKKYPNAYIKATDVSTRMVKQCQLKFPEASRLTFKVENGLTPQMRSVDMVAANLVFQWIPDLEKLFSLHYPRTRFILFSTLLDGTFDMWIKACQKMGIQPGNQPFRTREQLRSSFGMCQEILFHEEKLTFFYKKPLEFLKSLKGVGAHQSPTGYTPQPLFRVLKTFPEGIEVTYNVAFVLLTGGGV